MNKEKEVRILSTDNSFELRSIGEGDEKELHIQGYALTFDSISEDLGFRETIRKGSLDGCDLSNIVFTFNHNMDKPLARNLKTSGKGSLLLNVDEKGLFFDAIPTDTTYSRDLIENMNEGILGKCSFVFCVDWNDPEAQTWDWDDGTRGYDFRTINKISKISDVSIVVNPAYESTSSTLYKRSKDEHQENVKKVKNKLLERKLRLELELI